MIKNLHGPRTIQSVWKEINSRVKDACRFRIRNIETLEDILITGFTAWSHGLPTQGHGVKCNETMYIQNVYDCLEVKWALLSPFMEVAYLTNLDWREAAQKVKMSYRKSAAEDKIIEMATKGIDLSRYKEIQRFDHSF